MARIVEFLSGDQLRTALVLAEEKKKLQLSDESGRSLRLPADKVLFEHAAPSVADHLESRESLVQEVDVPLLWETVTDDSPGKDLTAAELAEVYFDDTDLLHRSAIFESLLRDRLHFRRRGTAFQPRSVEDRRQLMRQQEAEARRRAEEMALTQAISSSAPPPEVCGRLESWLRGAEDKLLTQVLSSSAKDPQEHAFDLLLRAGHLKPTEDLAVLQANLKPGYPSAALAHATKLPPPEPPAAIAQAAFSIDDAETQEVDDVLTVTRDGDLLRVDIDIADVASFVREGDPVDREARRRASTVYLPTGVYYMLPERIGCDLASLRQGASRPVIRTSAWFNEQGELQRHTMSRVTIAVDQRLDYDAADRLLSSGEGSTADALRLLDGIAAACRAARQADGAISFQRREWKLRVSPDGADISITPIPPDSPSRALVAEMMILANRLAASSASEAGLPMIYRVQPPPPGPVPDVSTEDPAAFARLRGLMQPASLSLEPGWHWGLGVRAYTQVTSPLRRYADLVAQRQLTALMKEEPAPYDAASLLKVLAQAEAVERDCKRTESRVVERWALEVVARLEDRSALPGQVIAEAPGGYKVMLLLSGAVGLLSTRQTLELGAEVTVDVKTVRPRRGVMRLVLADPPSLPAARPQPRPE